MNMNDRIMETDIQPNADTVIEQSETIANEIKVAGKPLIHSKIFWVQVITLILSIAVMMGTNIPDYYIGFVAAAATIAFRYLNPDITGIIKK